MSKPSDLSGRSRRRCTLATPCLAPGRRSRRPDTPGLAAICARMRKLPWAALCWLAPIALVAGCDCGGTPSTTCTRNEDCTALSVCIDGTCVSRPDGSVDAQLTGDVSLDAVGPAPIDGSTDLDGCAAPCGATCCGGAEVCVSSRCVAAGPTCTTSDDCLGDTYCEPTVGRCVGYVEGGSDRACTREIPAGVFSPTVQCQFSVAPAGDPYPEHVHVQGTPTVIDFGIPLGPDDPSRPSIVAAFAPNDLYPAGPRAGSQVITDARAPGVIRVLDGETCQQRWLVGGSVADDTGVVRSSPPALADLDGDGRAEIIAFKRSTCGWPVTAANADCSTLAGLIAFRYAEATDSWEVYWRATDTNGAPWHGTNGLYAGPTVADLDDDGRPEILVQAAVFDSMGRLQAATLPGVSSPTGVYSAGQIPVVADVDDDGRVEYVGGDGVWEWREGAWALEEYVGAVDVARRGFVAIADFGNFPGARSWPATTPEIVVINTVAGSCTPSPRSAVISARIQTLDGTIVFGPIVQPLACDSAVTCAAATPRACSGNSGPPTIADFDGDGLPEFATANGTDYYVYDPDCAASPRPSGLCSTGNTTGVLWTRPSQDASSAVTGSSVFDFENDGRAEVVYGDECYLRVYDGRSGDVLFSQARSSCTWYENPIVADLDGDFNAEIAIGDNHHCAVVCEANRDLEACTAPGDCASGNCTGGFCRCSTDMQCTEGRTCGRAAPSLPDRANVCGRQTDPLFPGFRCGDDADCLSGSCVEGLCRCTSDAQCCSGEGCDTARIVCVPPPAGTPGTGNTCRAERINDGTVGIRVFRDVADLWVRTRTVWNQHAYWVTNVEEDGTIPRTRDWVDNWTAPGLDNFRQNVAGDLVRGAAPDLTVSVAEVSCLSDGSPPELVARICNRGSDPVGDGVRASFFASTGGDAGDAGRGTLICAPSSVRNLLPGQCEAVRCAWPDAPPNESAAVDVTAVADVDGLAAECREGNNEVVFRGVYCGIVI